MKRVGNLFPTVTAFANIYQAIWEAAKGKKSRDKVQKFLYAAEYHALELQSELTEGRYCPGDYRTFTIFEPKTRIIAAAPFRDRVVHHAICRVIEPHLERSYIFDSYACRRGKGSHRAIQRAMQFSRRFGYYLRLDIRQFFPSLDHATLRAKLATRFKDPKLLHLLDKIIAHKYDPSQPTGKGLPIGNLTSQHFANFHLDSLDHFIKERLQFSGMVRYMDDVTLWADSKDRLHHAHGEINAYVEDQLCLRLKHQATILAPVTQGMPFLGFRIFPGTIKIKRANWQRFCRNWRRRHHQHRRRQLSTGQLIASVQSMLGFVKSGDTWYLLAKFLGQYDNDL